LIVANATYDDPALAALRSPGHDAEALVRVLGDAAIGGFQAEALVDADERTIRRRVAAFFTGRDRDDVLLLHFSCHGVKDSRGRLHLAARDTDLSVLGATAIPATFVNDLLSETQSRRVILILDCCYSGAFARGAAVRAGDEVQIADEFGAGTGRIVLTASSATEYSFEDGELTRSQGQPSAFTGALVRGLETGEADLDGDGEISIDELYDYTYRAVRDTATGQAPMKWSYGMEGSLLVARSVRPAVLPASILDDLASDRVVLRLEGVRELTRILGDGRPGLQAAARSALERLRDNDDSVRVRTAAADALGGAAPPVEAKPPTRPIRPEPAEPIEPEPARPVEPARPTAAPAPPTTAPPARPTTPPVLPTPLPPAGPTTVPSVRPTTAPVGLLAAASVLAILSAVLYLVGSYVVGTDPLADTWFLNLNLVPMLLAAVMLLTTRQIGWAALLAGFLSWELTVTPLFLHSGFTSAVPGDEAALLRLANVSALAVVACTLTALLLVRGPAARIGWPGRAALAILLAAATIPASVVGANLFTASFVYTVDEGSTLRVVLAVVCGLVPPLVLLVRPAGGAITLVCLGWLLGGAQIALDITVFLGQRNPYAVVYHAVPWLLLVGVLVVMFIATGPARLAARPAEPLH
jgi:hypothetical protein